MKAIWNNIVVADSDQTIKVDGNHFFPPNTVKHEYLEKSETHTSNPKQGEASYYHVKVQGDVNLDAAWCYPDPKHGAEELRSYIAFGNGVKVQD